LTVSFHNNESQENKDPDQFASQFTGNNIIVDSVSVEHKDLVAACNYCNKTDYVKSNCFKLITGSDIDTKDDELLPLQQIILFIQWQKMIFSQKVRGLENALKYW
jgi:hypothetical protein